MNYPLRKPVFRFDYSWQEFAEIGNCLRMRFAIF